MSAEVSLRQLHEQLREMQDTLREGSTEPVQELLVRHDRDLRAFLQGPEGAAVGAPALTALLEGQQGLHEALRALRDQSAAMLGSQRQAGHASRSYLAASQD